MFFLAEKILTNILLDGEIDFERSRELHLAISGDLMDFFILGGSAIFIDNFTSFIKKFITLKSDFGGF